MTTRESMPFDVVIIGGGPAGLSASIHLSQLAKQNNTELSICVLEKGAEIGAHTLAGAVIEPRALNELLPNWQDQNAPLKTSVADDQFVYLTQSRAVKLPTPPQMHNHSNYVASLGLFTRWLAEQAEGMGVDIFPGFAASEILYEGERVMGVATAPTGINKDGTQAGHYEPGMEIHAKVTLFAEGCRGSLSRQLIEKFNLDAHSQPQTYALGIKEIWEVPAQQHLAGTVLHSIGWPLKSDTYGGGFLYHLENNQVAVGFAVGLDYSNPYLSPFEEFQRYKSHPVISKTLSDGKRISYGARALSEGGLQSIPKLNVQGALLIGDSAGFLNVPKIKGTHTAMKSGMLAAEQAYAFVQGDANALASYDDTVQASWIGEELRPVRNIRPGFRKGLWLGLANAALISYITRGKEPWTLKHHADHQSLNTAANSQKIHYPKPDGVLSFDRLSSVHLSNTNHEENQPAHLTLKDATIPISTNLALYDAPEQRYCPAQVYEITEDEAGQPMLQINAQNCVHCKTCDIKDPLQNIVWTPPEGGGGPLYTNM